MDGASSISPADRYYLGMSKLVPEKRIDKNGRAVTRHVKPPAPPSDMSLYAPLKMTNLKSMARNTQSEDAAFLMRALFVPSSADPDAYLTPDGQEVPMSFVMFMRAIPSDTLNMVADRVPSMSQEERSVVRETLIAINNRYDPSEWGADYAEEKLHYSTELAPCVVTYAAAGASSLEMHNAVMHIAGQIANVFKGRNRRLMFADEGEKEVVRGALVNHLLTGAYFETRNVLTLSWIGRNLDRIEPFKEVIRERGTMNRELVEEIMSADANPLAGGYL